MSNQHFEKFAKFLAENPGSTAEEIGLTSVEANRLEKAGRIIRIGSRETGKPGRRPIEYALPGQEGVKIDQRVTDAQDKARFIVQEHDAHERVMTRMWRLRDNYGYYTAKAMPEYAELEAARDAIRSRYDGSIPPVPTPNQMIMAGVQTVGAPIEGELPVVEA